MAEPSDRPETDTSPTGEIAARRNEDGSYEILAEDSSATNMTPDSTEDTADPTPSSKSDRGLRSSPILIGLIALTVLATAGTIAYFATGGESPEGEQAEQSDDLSFQPYEGDEQAVEPAEPVEEPEQAAAMEEDAASFDEDAGPRERKTEIIVLEEEMDEDDPSQDGSGAEEVRFDAENLKRINVGPGTAARLKDSTRLDIDPGKLRDIKFTNGKIPKAIGQPDRSGNGETGASEATPEDQPPADFDRRGADEQVE